MKSILLVLLSFTLLSCNSSDPSGQPGQGPFVENIEDINKLREELSSSWETWRPQTRNQRDIVTHVGGEMLEGVNGLDCHYIYSSINYTTTWNREADEFDLNRELLNYTLGPDTTEDHSICNLRANGSNLGDSLGLGMTSLISLYLDQLDQTDYGTDPMPFDELKAVAMRKYIEDGLTKWELKYFIRANLNDFSEIDSFKTLKNEKSNETVSGYLTFTFASEVPFTAWLLKSGYDFKLSDGTILAGEELAVNSINGSPIK